MDLNQQQQPTQNNNPNQQAQQQAGGGFNNPLKVIIPTNVSSQHNRNVPRRNTMSAKASNATSVLNELTNEMKDSNPNSNQNIVGAQNPPKVNPASYGQKAGAPGYQFQQNPNSQQNSLQQKQRRVSDMQYIQQRMQQNQQTRLPLNQQPMQRYLSPQQQHQNFGQAHPQQFQNNRIPQGQQQNPNQPYPQQMNQNRPQQFQKNPQQMNQNRPPYQQPQNPQQNLQNQNPQQNMQNQNPQQNMQNQNPQQNMQNQFQNQRQRRQTTNTSQQPFPYQRQPPGTNAHNNLPSQARQAQEYSANNHPMLLQNSRLPKSSSTIFTSKQLNAPPNPEPAATSIPSSIHFNQPNQRMQQQQNWQRRQPPLPPKANRQNQIQQQQNQQQPIQQPPIQQQPIQQQPIQQQPIQQPPIQQQPIQQQQNQKPIQQPPIQQQPIQQQQNQKPEQDQLQKTVIPPLSLQQNDPINQQSQYNNESSSVASSPNAPPIKIQSDIPSDIEQTSNQQASSAPSEPPISDQFLSTTKRESLDDTAKGIICDDLIKSDEYSDAPIESTKKESNLNQEGQEELQKESISLEEIINECLINCPLSHQIDDEACKVLDSSIEQFINTKVRPKNLKWFSCYIPSCNLQANPYINNLALELSSNPEYKNNRTVKLFSSSIRHMKMNPVVEDISSHTCAAYPTVFCINDPSLIKDRSKIMSIVKKPIHSASNCYVRKFKTDVSTFNIKDVTAMALPKRRYLNMSLMTFEFKSEKASFEKVEPFFMCGYLINNGEMISEPWYFAPSDTKQFNPNIKLNQNGSFELPTIPLSEVYFVIVILRKILPENGAAINKYYKTPGPKTLSLAKEQAKFGPVFPAVLAPFAWTFVDVDSIVRNKSTTFVMPQPFLITGLIKPFYKSLKSVSGQVIPIETTFRVALQNDVIHPYELTFTNDCVLSLTTSPPEIPRFAIYHSFTIRIISAALHTKKRNIYALLTIKKGETEELPLIYYPYRIGRASKNFTKCWYHEKKPIFDDLYVCAIPNPIPQDFKICIKFYNASLKNVTKKDFDPISGNNEQSTNSCDLQEPDPMISDPIGIAKIPLLTEEGDFIPDGIKSYSVLHIEDNQTIPGCLTLETHLNSSFISFNRMLNHFYNEINAEAMTQIDPSDAIINLFNLLDQLVVGINTEPEESVKSLVELSRKVAAFKPAKAENKTNFIDFSARYAFNFAFISDQTISKDFHRNLLHNWALLIEADINYRISLRTQNSDLNNNVNSASSSNLLSMSNLSLSSGSISVPGQMTRSSSASQFSLSPRSSSTSQFPVSPRTSNPDNCQSESNQDNSALDQDQAPTNILSSDFVCKIQSDRSDFYLIDFFFILIIKSLYLTNDREFSAEFNEFTTSWSKASNRNQIKSYSIFINLLFDIGHYTYATHAIGKQVLQIISTNQSTDLLLPFLTQVLRPRLFYPSVLLIDDFVQLMQTIITYSKQNKIIFKGIFDILLRIFIYYNDQMKQEVTSRLINVYTILCDYKELPIDSEDHSCIYFYIHLFQNTTFEAFQGWYSKQSSQTLTLFFNTVQLLIKNVKNNDLARVLDFAILNILTHIMKLKNKDHILKISLLVYNLFCCNLAVDFIPDLITFFGNLVEQYYIWLVESSVPTIGKHIAKIFDLSCYCPKETNEFFKKLFDVDMANFNNHRRSMSICCRSLLFIKTINNVTIFEDSMLYPIVQYLKEYEIYHLAKISEEKLAEVKFKRAMILIHSPDATVHYIDSLIEFHQENEYFQEELQTRIFKIALVFEYLGCTGIVDYSYLHVERPSLLFADDCPIIKEYIACPSDGNFRIPSYCDSSPFSLRSLICDMMSFITRTIETNMYEFGYSMIDKFWPIMEHYNKYALVSKSFNIFSRCYSETADIPSDADRLFGRYFRVSLYGKCFKEENGLCYIYREKKLTHLFELSKRLTEFYSDLYQPVEIELIKEAGAVDVSTLDVENKGYIQVTFVEPSFKKKIDKDRITSFEKNHLLTNFYFDTPFTKEGKKAQSTVDQQWIRRTVLTVEHEMPTIFKRAKIIKETDREFPPIRVAYRQLRERITMFENAITQEDYRNIQQLLHGSLLVQVNEGPSKMAEIFLSDNCEKTKYTYKLEGAFKNFLEINEKALEMHGKWVTENPVFVPLQHELESGYASLVEKLSKWIS